MSVTHNIELDNAQNKYYSGETLSGRVNLAVHGSEPAVLEVFLIEIIGQATYTGSGPSAGSSKSINEIVLFKKICFRENENLVLQPGMYAYSFTYKLPASLPSSFEGDFGFIRYDATVEIRYDNKVDRAQPTKFIITKYLNLNDNIALKKAVHRCTEQTFYYYYLLCCCETAPMEIRFRISHTGYVPGQTINVEINAVNLSNVAVYEFMLHLNRCITFITRSTEKERKILVKAQNCTSNCPTLTSRSFQMYLVIPPTPPTDLAGICKIEYFLTIFGMTEGLHNDIVIDIPITIGTVPFILQATRDVNILSYPDALSSNAFPETSAAGLQPASVNRPSPNVKEGTSKPCPSAPDLDDGLPSYEEAARTGIVSEPRTVGTQSNETEP